VGVWTIGYGTNLQVLEIDEETAVRWLMEELEGKRAGLLGAPGFKEADDVRQDVLVEMAYQLGVRGCRSFKRMWAAVERQDWWAAASEMLDSKWAREDSPRRAVELATRMRSGKWDIEEA
jgi:lysozyme